MTRLILISLLGSLVLALPAGATPIESYGFNVPAATDTGDTLRRLLIAGQTKESSAPAMLGKSATPTLRATSVTPGQRRVDVLITQAMTSPVITAASAGSAGPGIGDDRVLISEPPMALLMLAGLVGLIRRKR